MVTQQKRRKEQKMMNKKFLAIFALMLCALGNVLAQTELENQEIIIDKKKKIEFPEANRNFEKVVFTPKPTEFAPQTYSYEDNHKLLISDYNTKMKVLIIKEEPLKKLYANYVKAGLGNYGTTYLEGWFNNKRADKLQYGAHFKHLASANGPVENSGSSTNRIDGYAKYFMKQGTLTGSLAYQRNRYNFYGYDHDKLTNVSKDDVKQLFNSFEAKALYDGYTKDSTVLLTAGVNYGHLQDHFKAKENEVNLNLAGQYKISPTSAVNVAAGLTLLNRADSTSQNRTIFGLRPTYHYTFNKLKVSVGLNFVYANDTLTNSKAHLYPVATVDYNLLDNTVIVFGGLDGGIQKNTLRSVTNEMPFINSNVAIQNTNKTIDFFAGIRGNLKGNIFYRVKVGYQSYKNMYFLVNDIADSSKFALAYDKTTGVVNVGGELGFFNMQKFRVTLKGDYYGYSTSDLDRAWHKPSFVAGVNGGYNLKEKIYFNVDFYLMSGINAKNFSSGKEYSLNTIADCNLKTEYRFSERFGAFVELNNIFAQRYQRYLNYQNKGFNVLVGLNATF